MPIERKLAAIMFTDIAGYTESMSKSESKTLNLLEKKRSILKPLIKEYKGTFVKEIGDGTLSYFESAVNAASCAVKLQENTYDDKDMNIRAGIHIGDIVFKDGDVFGGGVNVASRLESIAPAGGVCVSKSVYDELSNQDDFDGIELGLQSLKGVGRLVEVYGLKGEKLNEPDPKKYQDNKVTIHTDDEVPSIAIIPFRNKGKEADAFFAYGISTELISDCSGGGLIRVASIKDIENLDYNNLDTSNLSEKLSVRYVATGSLWKMGDLFHLSVELYDTKDKKVVWSDLWQEKWANLPSIKGDLSDGLLKTLNTKVELKHKLDTTNAEAYEYFLRGRSKWRKKGNKNDNEIARGLLLKALEIDNNFFLAKLWIGWTYSGIENDKALAIFKETLESSYVSKNESLSAWCLNGIGWIYQCQGYYNLAVEEFKKSFNMFRKISDNRGIASYYYQVGLVAKQMGEYKNALTYLNNYSKLAKKINDNRGYSFSLELIGIINKYLGNIRQSLQLLEESQEYAILSGSTIPISTYTFINSIKKELHIEYNNDKINKIITSSDIIDYETHFELYKLLEDTSYLETAYTQVQEKADNLEPDVAAKFLSYPIPKAIVEAWEKINKDKK